MKLDALWLMLMRCKIIIFYRVIIIFKKVKERVERRAMKYSFGEINRDRGVEDRESDWKTFCVRNNSR